MNLREVKFNGTIYGKPGAYSIYVNNTKVEVSSEDVEKYRADLKELEDLKDYKIGSIRIGLELFAKAKQYFEPTLEALREAKDSLIVENLFSGQSTLEDGTPAYFECIAVKNDVYSKVYVFCDQFSDSVRTYKYESKDKIKAEFNA